MISLRRVFTIVLFISSNFMSLNACFPDLEMQLSSSVPRNTLQRPARYWAREHGNCLTKTISPESQREDWYKYSSYVAEPFCAASNAALVIAACALKDTYPLSAGALIVAGSVSALSHAIPYQSLTMADTITTLAAIGAVAYDAELHYPEMFIAKFSNPKVLYAISAASAMYGTDMLVAHGQRLFEQSKGLLPKNLVFKKKSEHAWLHVMWHFLAALSVYTVVTEF